MSELVTRENQNTKSLKILRTIEEIQLACLNVETGMRGYLIVGDTSYLNPYINGKQKIEVNTSSLIKYSREYRELALQVIELRKNTSALVNIADELVLDEYTNHTDSLKRINLLRESRKYMDGIRSIINEIEEKERVILRQTNVQNISKARLTKVGYFTITAIAIAILIVVFFIVRNELYKRRIAEHKLLESSNRIFDLYNNAPCGYHSVGNDNIIIAMNDTELKWLGYPRHEVVGVKSIFDIIDEKDHVKIHSFIDKVKQGKVEVLKDLELCYKRKNGTCFDVMLNSTVHFDINGKSVSTRTAVLDITELKISKEKISLLNEELNHNNDQLKEINAELESFSYSVSHDLRAPLRAIDGYCKIILEDYSHVLDEEAQRIFNVIMSNSERMGQLIDDLLDYSRLGRRETSEVILEPNDLLSEIITEMQIPANYTLSIDNLDTCVADRVLLKQVWTNLLSNSVKYSSKILKPFIHIFSYKEDNEIIYCIEDNGVGFDEKYKHKLFNVFQRLHHDDEYEGTGVGLAIVHKIITKHKGRVWAESVANKSTKFYFSIPNP
jgi:PAS domain S-box-containing protein